MILEMITHFMLTFSLAYWDLLTGRLQRGTDGPVAIETKLGWVLSGLVAILGQTDKFHSLVAHTLHISAPITETTQTLDDTMKSFWVLWIYQYFTSTD